jgi:hypothetical protein
LSTEYVIASVVARYYWSPCACLVFVQISTSTCTWRAKNDTHIFKNREPGSSAGPLARAARERGDPGTPKSVFRFFYSDKQGAEGERPRMEKMMKNNPHAMGSRQTHRLLQARS